MLDAADLSEDHEPPLTESVAEAYVGGTCFKTGPPELVGVELEWLVHDADAPMTPVPSERVWAALADLIDHPARPALASGGSLTTEPGGQLELSSPPAPLATCLKTTAADLATLRDRLAAARLALVGAGLDPTRPPTRHSTAPRYTAMEQHFDRRGQDGRLMMCSTASVQVCLDAGADDAEVAARWDALHALGPVLVALFANSPLRGGRPTGWRCTRQAIWSRIDPSRTRPPAASPLPPRAGTAGADRLRESYARFALDADLLAVQRADGPWDAPAGLSFRGWLRGDGPPALGSPAIDDLDYHLSTLFPPVRARGHFELRVIDAQPADRWRLVTAAVAALLDEPAARDSALAAAEPVAGRWTEAARSATAAPDFARAGVDTLVAAADGMRRAGLPDLAAAAEEFADLYPARGRSPADDLLDTWAGNGKSGSQAPTPAPLEGNVP